MTAEIIREALAAKAEIARAEGSVLAAWWKLGDVVVRAVTDGYTLTSLADAIGYSKGSLSKAQTIRNRWDRPTAVEGSTVAEAYSIAKGDAVVTKSAPAKFSAERVLVKLDKRQRRALYLALQAEFGN